MEQIKINFLAILVAVVANFILGALWYMPLFGKIWGKEMNFDASNKPKTSDMMKGMISMLIGNFLFAWVLAHNISAWSFVPGIDTLSPTANILMSAIFTWIGFYLPVDLGTIFWEKKSFKLFSINTGYHLASLLVVSAILILM